MTKTERIRRLTDGTRSTTQIAETVGCSPAYVRAVWQRMRGGGISAADRKYREKRRGVDRLDYCRAVAAGHAFKDHGADGLRKIGRALRGAVQS